MARWDVASGIYCFFLIFAVMAGLVPAIHALMSSAKKDVDARDRPGHDD
jgi:hypothetical protein